MNNKLKILIALLILGGAGGFYGWYLYNKPVANTEAVQTDMALSATDLFADFESDETSANTKYLDKFLEVSGVVRSISKDEMGVNLVLEAGNDFFGINCAMETGQEQVISGIKEGEAVVVKGKCAGFNGDVVLVNGILIIK